MMRKSILSLLCFLGLVLGPNATFAIEFDELKKYDKNENKCIDRGREEDLLIAHLLNPILRKFDHDPMNGRLDLAEIRRIEAFGNTSDETLKLATAATETQIDELRSDLETRRCNLTDLADKPKPAASKEKTDQRLFLRKNRLDVSIYNKSIDSSAAEGANISFAADNRLNQRSLGLEGYLSYVLARDRFVPPPKDVRPDQAYLSGYAIAPYFQFNRVMTGGKNAPGETDKLGFGVASQFEIFSGPLFGNQVFTLAPYLQTDSEGQSQIYGGSGSWEPYNTSWGIGLGERRPFLPGTEFSWQFHGDVNYRFVDRPGQTGLKLHDDYMWVGGGARATIWLLPELFESKLFFVLSPSYYYDLQGAHTEVLYPATLRNRTAALFESSLNYNLDTQGISSAKITYKRGYDIQMDKEFDLLTGSVGVKF